MAKIDLSTVAARDGLAPRRHEYFQNMGEGYLGYYRSGAAGNPDRWCGRWRDPKTGKQHIHRMDDIHELAPAQQFKAAKAELEDWVSRMQGAAARAAALGVPLGASACETVGDALRAYAGTVKDKGMPARLAFLVLGGGKNDAKVDPLAAVKLSDPHLRRELSAWRERISKGRGTAVVNRDLTPIRAALNMEAEYIVSTKWQEALKPGDPAKHEVGEAMGVYRSKDERRQVIAEMSPAGKLFFTAMARLPVRPGMLADLNIEHFNKASNQITVGYDKKHPRTLAVPASLGEIFREAAGKRSRGEPLFLNQTRLRWYGKSWDTEIKFAAALALGKRGQEWDDSATWSAYDFRHSTITDLIEAGVAVTTVAKVAGTSPEMIYRRYHHLLDRNSVAALEWVD